MFGDLFTTNLSGADVVTCYLLQKTNDQLEATLKRELRPGVRVVSNEFTFSGLQLLRQDDRANLYLYGQNGDTHQTRHGNETYV